MQLSKKILSPDSIIQRECSDPYSYIDDEIVMLNVRKGLYYNFNSIGSQILELIEKPMSLKDLIQELKLDYDTSNDQIEEETKEFILELLNEGLVKLIKK